MILERELSQRGAVILPSYFGTDAYGMIVGTGSEPGVEILKNMIEGLRYQGAFDLVASHCLNAVRPNTVAKKVGLPSRRYLDGLRNCFCCLKRTIPAESALDQRGGYAGEGRSLCSLLIRGATLPSQAEVCTDADGAIHITWEIAARSLELVCPFDETDRTYIYFSDEANDRLAFDFSKSRLRALFSWLNGWTSDYPK